MGIKITRIKSGYFLILLLLVSFSKLSEDKDKFSLPIGCGRGNSGLRVVSLSRTIGLKLKKNWKNFYIFHKTKAAGLHQRFRKNYLYLISPTKGIYSRS